MPIGEISYGFALAFLENMAYGVWGPDKSFI